MARQTRTKLSATIGNVIFYERWGEHYIRSKPERVRQTAATEEAALRFATANSLGKLTRNTVKDLLPMVSKRPAMYQLATAYNRWLKARSGRAAMKDGNLPHLAGLNWNPAADYQQCCRVTLNLKKTGTNGFTLTMDAFEPAGSITAPAHTTQITLTLILLGMDIQKKQLAGLQSLVCMAPYNDTTVPPQTITTDWQTNRGRLTLAIAGLRYYTGPPGNTEAVSEGKWMPCAVMDGWYG